MGLGWQNNLRGAGCPGSIGNKGRRGAKPREPKRYKGEIMIFGYKRYSIHQIGINRFYVRGRRGKGKPRFKKLPRYIRYLATYCLDLEKENRQQQRAMFQMTRAYQQATRDLTMSELELLSCYRKLKMKGKTSVLLQAKALENPLRTEGEQEAIEAEISNWLCREKEEKTA
jgi:hypothetical protein